MKSDVMLIDNQGNGFEDCVRMAESYGESQSLGRKQTIQLKMITQEMLSLARSVTGEMQASFWIENEGRSFSLYMTTNTVLDKDKRYQLISSATSRRNEIETNFLGKLRDAFEQAMTAEADHDYDLPQYLEKDVGHIIEDPEWDGFERSVLRGISDDIRIAIRGREVRMTVSKSFAE